MKLKPEDVPDELVGMACVAAYGGVWAFANERYLMQRALAAVLPEHEKQLLAERDALKAAIERATEKIIDINDEIDEFEQRHNPECECETIPAVRETLNRIDAALHTRTTPEGSAEVEGVGWHWGPDPAFGNLTKHVGPRAQCSGPDCAPESPGDAEEGK